MNSTAITTKFGIAPCDDRAIREDGRETSTSGLDLLHILQLVLNDTAITTPIGIAPGDDRAIREDGSESRMPGLDLLHILQLSLNATAITTKIGIAPCQNGFVPQNRGECARARCYLYPCQCARSTHRHVAAGFS